MEVRKGYKQTEVGVIPEDWKVKMLGDFSSISSGGTPSRIVASYWDGNIPWITTSQIDFNIVDEAIEFITEEGLKNSAAKIYKAGTLLMAMYGQGKTRGKIAILGINATTNQACAAISLNNEVLREIVFYNLAGRYDEIRSLSNNGNQENLNGDLIKKILLALPPTRSEQTAIANALSDADALITSLEKLIEKKRAIKQGAMQKLLSEPGFAGLKDKQDFEMGNNPENPAKVILSESECSGLKDNQDWKINKNPENPAKVMLSESECSGLKDNQDWKINKNPENPANPINPDSDKWEVKKLGEIFSITAGGDLDTDNFSSFYDDKYCYPIYSNSLSDKGLYGYSSMFTSEKDTITVTARGTVGYANSRDHRYTAIGRVLILNPIQKLDCFFISELINNRLVFANESTGVPQLTAPQISKYEISIPTFEEQTRIATILSDMDAEITVLEQKLAKYKQIKQGMMQELLTGKIRLNQDLQD